MWLRIDFWNCIEIVKFDDSSNLQVIGILKMFLNGIDDSLILSNVVRSPSFEEFYVVFPLKYFFKFLTAHYKKKLFFPRIITHGFFLVCKLILSTENSMGNVITPTKRREIEKIYYLRMTNGGKYVVVGNILSL